MFEKSVILLIKFFKIFTSEIISLFDLSMYVYLTCLMCVCVSNVYSEGNSFGDLSLCLVCWLMLITVPERWLSLNRCRFPKPNCQSYHLTSIGPGECAIEHSGWFCSPRTKALPFGNACTSSSSWRHIVGMSQHVPIEEMPKKRTVEL